MYTAHCHRYEASKAMVSNAKVLAGISDLTLRQARELLLSLEPYCHITLNIAAEPIDAVKSLHQVGFDYAYIDVKDGLSIQRHGFSDYGPLHEVFRHPEDYSDEEISDILSKLSMNGKNDWTTDGTHIYNIADADSPLIEDDYEHEAIVNYLRRTAPIAYYTIKSTEAISRQRILNEFMEDDYGQILFPDMSIMVLHGQDDETCFIEFRCTFFSGPHYLNRVHEFILANHSQVIRKSTGCLLPSNGALVSDYKSHPVFRKYLHRLK